MDKSIEGDFFNLYRKIDFSATGVAQTCFTISNTSKSIDKYYFTPIRIHLGLLVCGVVVSNVKEAVQFAKLADGNFDYVAVDSEKKLIPQNIL